jgi:cation transporter-like permease
VTIEVVGNLAAVLTLLPAIALGRAERVTHFAQLAHPVTIGLVLAVAFLVALARFRLGLELEGLLPPPLVPTP